MGNERVGGPYDVTYYWDIEKRLLVLPLPVFTLLVNFE